MIPNFKFKQDGCPPVLSAKTVFKGARANARALMSSNKVFKKAVGKYFISAFLPFRPFGRFGRFGS